MPVQFASQVEAVAAMLAGVGAHPGQFIGSRLFRCPRCSEHRKKKSEKCLSVKSDADGFVFYCHHCEWHGGSRGAVDGSRTSRQSPINTNDDRAKQERALAIGRESVDPRGTPVDVTITHVLHRDYETRSRVDLKKVGAAKYAADPSTEVLCVAYAVDDGPVQLWRPGDPVPAEFIEAAANPSWVVAAHNDAFESAIEQHVLRPLRLADHSARAPPLHHGDVPGARAAGKAERRG